MSFQCADILTEVLGKKIVHVNLSSDEVSAHHIESLGVPADYATALAMMDVAIKHGSEEKLDNVVLGVTGKNPRTFRGFAEDNKKLWL